MKNKLSDAQMKQAICAHFHITPTQFELFGKMLPTLQPWEIEFLNTLLEERSKDKQEVSLLRTLREYDWNLGESSNAEEPPLPFKQPGGYQVRPTATGRFAVFRDGKLYADDLDSKDAAVAAAYTLDRKDDPYRWRDISETCPASEFLLFACQDWAHSVELGKPVPVKTGYRGEEGYKVLGASWRPTHWCYQPEAPKVANAGGQPETASSAKELEVRQLSE